MMELNAHVPEPEIAIADGTPSSVMFGDVYFSRAGGAAETEHVFLAGNDLPARWCGKPHFTIGELGFGTGLNFLVTWQKFIETAAVGAQLHYLAIEQFPWTRAALAEVLESQLELAPLAAQLLAALPLRLPGLLRIHLPRVTLTLCYGEAAAMLRALDTPVDAWFLDGFSPAKNAAMWREEVLSEIGRLAPPEGSFATFTAAGFVKRGLAAQGFTVHKVSGFGHKREMLVGRKSSEPRVQSSARGIGGTINYCAPNVPSKSAVQQNGCVASNGEPRSGGGLGAMSPAKTIGGTINYCAPNARQELEAMPPSEKTKALILGAGIAGATLAHALALRGVAVTVLEAGTVASGASGNAAAVLFPQLSKRWTAAAAWYFAAYDYTLRQLPRWPECVHAQPGMLRLPRHADEEAQLRQLRETLGLDAGIVHWLEREEAERQAGVKLATGAAFFPRGTWIDPSDLCRKLLQHPNITLHTHSAAKTLRRPGNNWRVETENGDVFEAQHCCVAGAYETAALLEGYGLKLNRVAGQVSAFSAHETAAPLLSILCHSGYVIPRGEQMLVGATYNHEAAALAVTEANHAENSAQVEQFLPGWLHGQAVAGRMSYRATTPDRLPYVGAVDVGLYVSSGHGSRGMLSAPFAAEVIASMIAGEQVPLAGALRKAVNPLRFKK